MTISVGNKYFWEFRVDNLTQVAVFGTRLIYNLTKMLQNCAPQIAIDSCCSKSSE